MTEYLIDVVQYLFNDILHLLLAYCLGLLWMTIALRKSPSLLSFVAVVIVLVLWAALVKFSMLFTIRWIDLLLVKSSLQMEAFSYTFWGLIINAVAMALPSAAVSLLLRGAWRLSFLDWFLGLWILSGGEFAILLSSILFEYF